MLKSNWSEFPQSSRVKNTKYLKPRPSLAYIHKTYIHFVYNYKTPLQGNVYLINEWYIVPIRWWHATYHQIEERIQGKSESLLRQSHLVLKDKRSDSSIATAAVGDLIKGWDDVGICFGHLCFYICGGWWWWWWWWWWWRWYLPMMLSCHVGMPPFCHFFEANTGKQSDS